MNIWIKSKARLKNTDCIKKTIDFLRGRNIKFSICKNTQKYYWKIEEIPEIKYNWDLDILIVFGWDGSILRANQLLWWNDVKILWVNMWSLGFLSEINPDTILDRLKLVLEGEYTIDEREMLCVCILRWKKELKCWRALNDAVISYNDLARLIHVKARVDGKVLAHYKSDWLIVSTPTWSTAYNISAWWPILYPKIPANIITPICSHSFTQKPIVLPDTKEVILEISPENRGDCALSLDGQVVFEIERWDRVRIRKAKETFKFIRFPWEHFYKVIRKKLKWWENL